jgi:hypothetical protein
MLHIGRNVSSDPTKIILSAHFVLEEVSAHRSLFKSGLGLQNS